MLGIAFTYAASLATTECQQNTAAGRYWNSALCNKSLVRTLQTQIFYTPLCQPAHQASDATPLLPPGLHTTVLPFLRTTHLSGHAAAALAHRTRLSQMLHQDVIAVTAVLPLPAGRPGPHQSSPAHGAQPRPPARCAARALGLTAPRLARLGLRRGRRRGGHCGSGGHARLLATSGAAACSSGPLLDGVRDVGGLAHAAGGGGEVGGKVVRKWGHEGIAGRLDGRVVFAEQAKKERRTPPSLHTPGDTRASRKCMQTPHNTHRPPRVFSRSRSDCWLSAMYTLGAAAASPPSPLESRPPPPPRPVLLPAPLSPPPVTSSPASTWRQAAYDSVAITASSGCLPGTETST